MKEACGSLNAYVTDAPALGGVKMYQVKISCKGKSTSLYKTKEDFKNVINMFKLAGAMGRNKDNQCEVCANCSAMTMVRVCDEDSLNDFLGSVLEKLRKIAPETIDACSQHQGVIQILMDFLSVTKGKYFCELVDESSPVDAKTAAVQENDLDHPIAHCSLNRTLSQRFAAMDSVC